MSADAFGIGTQIIVRLPGINQPELSPLGTGFIYFDTSANKFKASENGGVYVDLVGGGAGSQTLAQTLVLGNTTGANNIVVSSGQKIVSAAASALTLDGLTTLDLQTASTTRWRIQAAPGHLVPQSDNAIDIGVTAVNRVRTVYAGTSVVVGTTTINGVANTIASSANLSIDTGAAGTLNVGATNATTINVGAGAGVTSMFAAADVTVAGNLTVNGTTTTINSTNLTVTDPLIYANNGGLDPSFAGLAWDQGAALDVIMTWNPTNNRFEFGRFNTVGGTVVPSGPLATLTSVRASNLSLAGTLITADAGLSVVATNANLVLEATVGGSVAVRTNGTTAWAFNTAGVFRPEVDDTYDIGLVGPVGPRPRTVYAATSVVVGNTITIGTSTISSSTSLTATSANGTAGSAGSALSILAGNGDTAGSGGQLTLSAGSSPAGTGGEVVVQTGNAALASRLRVLPSGFVGVGSGAPLSSLDVQGSFGHSVTSISTNTTADTTATVWLVDASGGAVTLTLPTAASASRRTYHVKKIDSSLNAVTIDAAGVETIDGLTTQSLVSQYESLQIVSDGSAWYIL